MAFFVPILGLVAAFIAVSQGMQARAAVKASLGVLGGNGMATTGLALGVVHLCLAGLFGLLYVLSWTIGSP